MHSRRLQFISAWSLFKRQGGVASKSKSKVPRGQCTEGGRSSLASCCWSCLPCLLCKALHPYQPPQLSSWQPGLYRLGIRSPPLDIPPSNSQLSLLSALWLPLPRILVPLPPLGSNHDCPPFFEIISTQPWCPFEQHPIFILFLPNV